MTTNIELHGHGDPLLEVTTKETKLVTVESEKDTGMMTAKVSHETKGHGDPLFQSVLDHDSPRTNPLHAEFKGQGDPFLDAFIDEWHLVTEDADTTEEKADTVVHEEMKHHGDPFLTETITHDTKIFETKQ